MSRKRPYIDYASVPVGGADPPSPRKRPTRRVAAGQCDHLRNYLGRVARHLGLDEPQAAEITAELLRRGAGARQLLRDYLATASRSLTYSESRRLFDALPRIRAVIRRETEEDVELEAMYTGSILVDDADDAPALCECAVSPATVEQLGLTRGEEVPLPLLESHLRSRALRVEQARLDVLKTRSQHAVRAFKFPLARTALSVWRALRLALATVARRGFLMSRDLPPFVMAGDEQTAWLAVDEHTLLVARATALTEMILVRHPLTRRVVSGAQLALLFMHTAPLYPDVAGYIRRAVARVVLSLVSADRALPETVSNGADCDMHYARLPHLLSYWDEACLRRDFRVLRLRGPVPGTVFHAAAAFLALDESKRLRPEDAAQVHHRLVRDGVSSRYRALANVLERISVGKQDGHVPRECVRDLLSFLCSLSPAEEGAFVRRAATCLRFARDLPPPVLYDQDREIFVSRDVYGEYLAYKRAHAASRPSSTVSFKDDRARARFRCLARFLTELELHAYTHLRTDPGSTVLPSEVARKDPGPVSATPVRIVAIDTACESDDFPAFVTEDGDLVPFSEFFFRAREPGPGDHRIPRPCPRDLVEGDGDYAGDCEMLRVRVRNALNGNADLHRRNSEGMELPRDFDFYGGFEEQGPEALRKILALRGQDLYT